MARDAGRRRRGRTAGTAVATSAFLALGLLAGCGGGHAEQVSMTVAQRTSLVDSTDPIVVSGLRPGQDVTIHAAATSSQKLAFASTAVFRAGSTGRVDLATQAPVSGSYTGVEPMGILASMAPPAAYASAPYADYFPQGGQAVQLEADVAGRQVATTSLTRTFIGPGVVHTALRPAHGGLYGELYQPPADKRRREGVLLFGGSEGGDSEATTAQLLAAHGYTAMSVAYFAEPGLPHSLARIPLEYFTHALHVLADEPGVDPHRLTVISGSYGTEAALLVAAHFPSLVHAVVVASPSNVVTRGGDTALGSLSCTTCSPWTLGGRQLPYQDHFGPTVVQPADAIPVEDITGSIMLVCGESDDTWPSCPMSEAMAARLRAHDRPAPEVLAYPGAGHFVDLLIPDISFVDVADDGLSAQDTSVARMQAWPKVLAFLAAHD